MPSESPLQSGDFEQITKSSIQDSSMESSQFEIIKPGEAGQVDSEDSTSSSELPELTLIDKEPSLEAVDTERKESTMDNDELISIEKPITIDSQDSPEESTEAKPMVDVHNVKEEDVDKDEAVDDKIEEIAPVEEEKKDPNVWTDILGSGRLYKKIVVEGEGTKLERGMLVKIEIYEPMKSFDMTFGTVGCETKLWASTEVLLGDGLSEFAAPAVELAVYEVKPGGIVAVKSHAELRNNVPEEFQIKVIEILEKNLIKLSNESKELGNTHFVKKKDPKMALQYYQRGIRLLNEFLQDNEHTPESKDIWTKTMKNIGRCYFKDGQNVKSRESFKEILAVDPKNVQVQQLMADVLLKEKAYDQTLKVCKSIMACEGSSEDPKIKEHNERVSEICNRKLKEQSEKHKMMCAKMFNSDQPKVEKPVEKVESVSQSVQPAEADKSESSNMQYFVLAGAAALGAIIFWQAKKSLSD